MLAPQFKHSLHKSWCGQADVGLLFWAAAYRQRRYIAKEIDVMNRKYFILLVVIFSLATNYVKAQSLFVGFGVGYNKIINENYFSHKTIDNNEFGLGLDGVYKFSAKIEYQLDVLPIFLVGDLSYLGGSAKYTYRGILNYIDSHFTNITIQSSLNIYSLSLGIKYPIHFQNYSPYFSATLLSNYFDEINIKQTPQPVDIFNYTPKKISSSLKLGLSFGTGINYKINNQFLLGLSFNYSSMNLTGKKEISSYIREDPMNLFSISANILYKLCN